MKIYDRKTKTYEDIVQYGAGKLDFLYNNPVGRIFLGIAVSPFVSNIYASKNAKKSSVKKIPAFIKEHNIDMSDFEDREYKSFTDFFTMPVTYTALIFPLLFLLKLPLEENIFLWIVRGAILLVSVLQVLKIKVIKPKGIWYGIFGILAIAMLVIYLVVI